MVAKLFHYRTYRYVNCELLRYSQSELTAILGIGKRKKTERTKGREGYEKTEFGQDAAISVEEEAIFVQSYKSCARDLDLEHILDARSPGDHSVQVWSESSHLSRSRSDLCKKFTVTRTDTQTDKRQTPRDCISSWNELKTKLREMKWKRPEGPLTLK